MVINIKVVLKSGKDQSLFRRHPWIFSGAIKKIYGKPEEGDLVKVYDNMDEYLRITSYNVCYTKLLRVFPILTARK